MSVFSSSLKQRRQKSRAIVRRHYHDRGWVSPYVLYKRTLTNLLAPGKAVLDIGCGRNFPMAPTLRETGAEVFGLDPVAECDPSITAPGVTIRSGSAEAIPFADSSFDVVTSCAVFEHLQHPLAVLAQCRRVLKPGGRVVFLGAGRYDYVSIIGRLVPNVMHQWIVRATEGRDEADTFPTFYRANDARQVRRLATKARLEIESLDYLNQFPYALSFSPLLCRLGIAYDRLIQRVRWLRFLNGWLMGVLRRPGGENDEK